MKTSRISIRYGVSLVELLVVIGIITSLLALIVPAVQYARESSRATTCKSNLKQIGLAMHMFVDSNGRLPSGGWGFQSQGFPDISRDLGQPGAWPYSVLPFIEQSSAYNLEPIRKAGLRFHV